MTLSAVLSASAGDGDSAEGRRSTRERGPSAVLCAWAAWVLLCWFGFIGSGCAATRPPGPPTPLELTSACLEHDRATCTAAADQLATLPRSRETQQLIARLRYRACLRGAVDACAQVADMYREREVRPPSGRRVRALFEHVCHHRFPYDPGACTAGALDARACAGGRAESCVALADLEVSGRFGQRDLDRARGLRARACELGDAASCAQVAKEVLPTAAKEASRWFAKGCDAADAGACAALGDLLERGGRVARDLARARELRRRGCDLGDGGACRALSDMWLRGVGGGVDRAKAFELLQRGCALNDADACLALAVAHERGLFDEPDMARHYELSGKAAKLYAPACDAGDAHACGVLGMLHRQGGGVREDRTLGLELQARACEAGDGLACIGWLSRGPHRISIQGQPKMAAAVTAACRRGAGAACFASGWIGGADLAAAGAAPPAHPFAAGCRAGFAPACNAAGIARFPPDAAGMAQLESACELGDAAGCHHLGVAKETRGEVDMNEEAVVAYTRGCRLGWMRACTRLGLMRRQGHVTPGASSARGAFEKACDGGDAMGCLELGRLMRSDNGDDFEVGMRLLERACKKKLAEACGELGRQRLRAGGEQRAQALDELRRACDAGAHRACVTWVEESGPSVDAKTLLDNAIEGATRVCDEGLAVCGGSGVAALSRSWTNFEGLATWQLDAPPACGIALERECLAARDAHVARCTADAARCFASASEVRRLAGAGLSISQGDAVKLEERGFEDAKQRCQGNDAGACNRLARAYARGQGTRADDVRAKRFQKRACALDQRYCDDS